MVEGQQNLFMQEESKPNLTTRQYRLHDLLIAHSHQGKLSHKGILNLMGDWYFYNEEKEKYPNRPFNNMKARRELSDDLDVVVRCETLHKVYVGGKYATSPEEAKEYLEKEKARLSSEWKKYWINYRRGMKDNQVRALFKKDGKVTYDTFESFIREVME